MDVEDSQEVMKGRIKFVCSKANLWKICDRIVRGEVLNQSKLKSKTFVSGIRKGFTAMRLLNKRLQKQLQCLGGALLVVSASGMAQQVTGTPGSSSATTTLSGGQLPPPDPTFGGVIKEKASEEK
jgi:hypothetical protein